MEREGKSLKKLDSLSWNNNNLLLRALPSVRFIAETTAISAKIVHKLLSHSSTPTSELGRKDQNKIGQK